MDINKQDVVRASAFIRKILRASALTTKYIAFPDLARYTRRGTAVPCPYTLQHKTVPHLNGKCYILRLILCIYLTLSSGVFFADSAFALLRQHHDAPGVLRYHSHVSIKDDFGYTWQVVLFKLFPPGKAVEFNLRLVGFPGVFELAHPQSLEIVTAKGKLLSASDVYAEKSPSSNVGDYNLTNVLFKLTTTDSLKLYVPLSGEQRLVLQIPASVVTEWQWLVTDFNS